MPEEPTDAEVEETEEGFLLRIRWDSFDHLETHYVNHVLISHAGPEFYLIFGELTPPFPKQRGISDQELAQHVKVNPKVKMALSPQAMLSIADAINTNIGRYIEQFEIDEESEFTERDTEGKGQ